MNMKYWTCSQVRAYFATDPSWSMFRTILKDMMKRGQSQVELDNVSKQIFAVKTQSGPMAVMAPLTWSYEQGLIELMVFADASLDDLTLHLPSGETWEVRGEDRIVEWLVEVHLPFEGYGKLEFKLDAKLGENDWSLPFAIVFGGDEDQAEAIETNDPVWDGFAEFSVKTQMEPISLVAPDGWFVEAMMRQAQGDCFVCFKTNWDRFITVRSNGVSYRVYPDVNGCGGLKVKSPNAGEKIVVTIALLEGYREEFSPLEFGVVDLNS